MRIRYALYWSHLAHRWLPRRVRLRATWRKSGAMKTAESILNALTEPVLLLDGSLRSVMANPAFYTAFGIAPGQLAGTPAPSLVQGESSQARIRLALEAVAAGQTEVSGIELKGGPPPAPPRLFTLRARRVTFSHLAPEMVLAEFRDITREHEAERRIQELNEALLRHTAELERSNRDLESFTHSASHDLRTPLRMTGKITHLLLQEHGSELPQSAVEKLHMILNTTEEMGNLIENLLAFSRLNHVPLKRRPVDPARVVRDVLRLLRTEREGRDVRLRLDPLPPCLADRALLKQVYQNLIANALKFTRPCKRAEIQVGFKQINGQGAYFVRDNGVGLDTSNTASIFNSFHRLKNARPFEGSGIGLSLVKRIVERHDGHVWAEGEPGRGAAIYFVLSDTPQAGRTIKS